MSNTGTSVGGHDHQVCIQLALLFENGFGWIARKGGDDFSLRSLLVAALGAVLLLLVLQALGGRGRGRLRRR